MKILHYNWVQFDNKHKQGGGVNVYLRNVLDYLTAHTEHEVYFLSSGWKYNPLYTKPYIKPCDNIFGDKCKTFEVINSPVIAPAWYIYMNPKKYNEDTTTVKIFDDFLSQHGPFDVIHFSNIEGISVNVLKLKEKYPNTKFIVSIHNYLPICTLHGFFYYPENVICTKYSDGTECARCSPVVADRKEYYQRAKRFIKEDLTGVRKCFKWLYKLVAKIIRKQQQQELLGSRATMFPEQYIKCRELNIDMLNRYADKILAVSDRVRQIMIQHGITPRKIVTSYIGTKFAETQLQRSVATETRPFTIAYLGYQRIDKGFFFFIDSLSKLDGELAKNVNVVLATEYLHKENYERQLRHFNKVIVHDGYTHEQLPDILREVNLGVVPVLWEDNLPQVAIEMVACGVPILCSSFGGASELCQSELFRFEGANSEAFLTKLKALIQKPELLAEFWKHHPKLTTIKAHIEELTGIYGE